MWRSVRPTHPMWRSVRPAHPMRRSVRPTHPTPHWGAFPRARSGENRMGTASRPGQTEAVTSLEAPRPHPLRRVFGPLAARDFWAEYAWLWLSGPLTLFSLLSFLVVLVAGLSLTPVLFGFLVLAGAIRYARGLGAAHRGLARALLGVSVPAPRRP